MEVKSAFLPPASENCDQRPEKRRNPYSFDDEADEPFPTLKVRNTGFSRPVKSIVKSTEVCTDGIQFGTGSADFEKKGGEDLAHFSFPSSNLQNVNCEQNSRDTCTSLQSIKKSAASATQGVSEVEDSRKICSLHQKTQHELFGSSDHEQLDQNGSTTCDSRSRTEVADCLKEQGQHSSELPREDGVEGENSFDLAPVSCTGMDWLDGISNTAAESEVLSSEKLCHITTGESPPGTAVDSRAQATPVSELSSSERCDVTDAQSQPKLYVDSSVQGAAKKEMPISERCCMADTENRQESDTDSFVQETVKYRCRVVYVHSQRMIDLCNQLPRVPSRAVMVHSLIEALGLLKFVKVLAPEQLETYHLLQFHSADYIEFLQKMNHQEDEEKIDEEEAEQYGLTFDCPVQDGVFDCATLVAGATVAAAQSLCDGTCDVAINWCGGWHHAQRSSASGFCYINDIALGILKLREKFSRILYVDLDLHHGDGVENAFCTTSRVMTVSFHKYAPGFFPGSGSIDDVGSGKGKFYTVNVPLHDGICDREYFAVFKRVMTSVQEAYKPEAVVCQCGADSLAGDPMVSFNLSTLAYIHCVRFLLNWHLPLLLLGGGGYHYTNTARCWATLTALCVDRRLPLDVPDHKFFPEYGPDYEMGVHAGHRKDRNTHEYLLQICKKVSENMQKIHNGQAKPL